MVSAQRSQALAALRDRLQALDKRPALAGAAGELPGDGDPVAGLATGVLHEVWADDFSHGGALAGFVLGAARRFFTPARPVLLWLGLSGESREAGLGYAPGFQPFGCAAGQVLTGRMHTIADLLWAAEEAIACPGVAAVAAETGGQHKALDFTATRRLNLRAAASGAPVFLLRYGREREATGAAWRWHVGPAPSAMDAFDARAPGAPRWRVRLEKSQGRGGVKQDGAVFMLRWAGSGFMADDDEKADRTGSGGAAISGALPAALGDGLSQTA